MSIDTDKEIVRFGIEIVFTGERENVGIAIENLAEDATIQEKLSDVEVEVREPVQREVKWDGVTVQEAVNMIEDNEDGWIDGDRKTIVLPKEGNRNEKDE
jgi:hypothetical protein